MARAGHATLGGMNELGKRQNEIMDGQNKVREILERSIPTRQPEARA